MSPARMEKIESAIRTGLELNKAFNDHDVEGLKVLISDDCVLEDHSPGPNGTKYNGKDAIVRFWQDLFRRSPNQRVEIEEIFGLGNRCVLRWVSKGTGKDERVSQLRGIDIYQVRDGTIFQIHSYIKG